MVNKLLVIIMATYSKEISNALSDVVSCINSDMYQRKGEHTKHDTHYNIDYLVSLKRVGTEFECSAYFRRVRPDKHRAYAKTYR